MKFVKKLSLFFSFSIFIYCFSIQFVYSQKTSDSLQYYYYKTVNPTQENDLTNAYLFYKTHIQKSLNQKDTLSAIHGIRMLAINEYNLGFLQDSEETCVLGITLLDNLKENPLAKEAKKGIYNQLGKIYRSLNNPEIALKYYNKALEHSINLTDSLTIINNKANIYRDLNQLEKAIDELSMVYEKSLKQKDTILISRALDNLGFVQSKFDMPEALSNLKTSYSYRLRLGDVKGLYSSLSHLSEYYKEKKNKPLAIEYALEAYKKAQEIKSSSFIEDALSRLLELHEDERVVRYIKLNDSIVKAKEEQQNKYASMQYDVSKEKSRADKNELLKEKEKSKSLLYLLFGVSILIMSTLFILYLNSRFKKEKLQQIYNTETRISKKVHDEVANDVYHVIAKLQNDKNINEDVLDDLEGIYSKTRDISKENSAINVNEGFDELLNDLLLSYKSSNVNVITRNISKIDWNTVQDIKKTTIYRVLQELMTNMKKHSKASVVVLGFKQVGKKLVIDYNDNGIGCNIKKHSGLQNAENRMQSIKGTITFESQINNGFKAKIVV